MWEELWKQQKQEIGIYLLPEKQTVVVQYNTYRYNVDPEFWLIKKLQNLDWKDGRVCRRETVKKELNLHLLEF